MIFENPLLEGVLIKRYKRFLADVKVKEGRMVTVHCPNTGSMTNCSDPGSRVWINRSNNEKRKYQYTLQIIQTETSNFVGINTNVANDSWFDNDCSDSSSVINYSSNSGLPALLN